MVDSFPYEIRCDLSSVRLSNDEDSAAKNSEITNLEGICVNLRLDLETKSNEILSLKIHAANSTSLNAKSYDTKKNNSLNQQNRKSY
jgi:hypothetical protein